MTSDQLATSPGHAPTAVTARSLVRDRAVRSSFAYWAALVVFTVASFALGGDHLIENRTLAAAVVVGIAAVKIRIVGIHFMELQHAPLVLRAFFEVYCALLLVVIMGIYLIA